MAILYTLGNINMATVELVAKSIRAVEPDLEIQKVVIFDSPESEEKQTDQIKIYRKYFGNFVREGVLINGDGTVDSSDLFSVFNNKEEKIVDLSNGQKSTTSLLYMAASLCQVKRIYYLMLRANPNENMVLGKDYEYIQMRQVDCASQLSKISCFDLIYYNDEISKLFTEKERSVNGPLRDAYDNLITGIREYFTGSNFRSVISNVTIINERIIGAFKKFILCDETCNAFCKRNNINISSGDTMKKLNAFATEYEKSGTNKEICKFVTLISLTSVLKEYRNISAHYAENGIQLTEDYARIAIILSIEVLKGIHDIPILWEILKEKEDGK